PNIHTHRRPRPRGEGTMRRSLAVLAAGAAGLGLVLPGAAQQTGTTSYKGLPTAGSLTSGPITHQPLGLTAALHPFNAQSKLKAPTQPSNRVFHLEQALQNFKVPFFRSPSVSGSLIKANRPNILRPLTIPAAQKPNT